MLMTEEADGHFMIGQTVEVNDRTGEIQTVIEHTIEEDGDRETHRRVIVDVGDREINAGSSDVEVAR